MSIKRHFSQAGDTIVEVMFAVAVIGMVIGGSYVIATRALRTGRYAQEQTEALKEAESQIEKLKYLASLGKTAPPDWIYDTAANQNIFCVNDTFHKVVTTAATPAADCTDKGTGQLYTVLVTWTAVNLTATATDLFNVTVTWDREAASLKGNVQISYRLHNAPAPASP